MIRELKTGQPRSRDQKRKDTFQYYKVQQWNKRRCHQRPQDDEDQDDEEDYSGDNGQWHYYGRLA